jgi:DNA-binding CsgD family transcriptional regulator
MTINNLTHKELIESNLSEPQQYKSNVVIHSEISEHTKLSYLIENSEILVMASYVDNETRSLLPNLKTAKKLNRFITRHKDSTDSATLRNARYTRKKHKDYDFALYKEGYVSYSVRIEPHLTDEKRYSVLHYCKKNKLTKEQTNAELIKAEKLYRYTDNEISLSYHLQDFTRRALRLKNSLDDIVTYLYYNQYEYLHCDLFLSEESIRKMVCKMTPDDSIIKVKHAILLYGDVYYTREYAMTCYLIANAEANAEKHKDALIALNGHSLRDIADTLGLSAETVKGYYKRLGIERTEKKKSKYSNKAKITQYRIDNPTHTQKQCSVKLRVSIRTVKTYWNQGKKDSSFLSYKNENNRDNIGKIAKGAKMSNPSYSNKTNKEIDKIAPSEKDLSIDEKLSEAVLSFDSLNSMYCSGENCLLPDDFYASKQELKRKEKEARKVVKQEKEAKEAMLGIEKKKKKVKQITIKKIKKSDNNNQQSIQFNNYGKQSRKRI